MIKLTSFLALVLMVGVLVISCSDDPVPTSSKADILNVGLSSALTLPPGATLTSAMFYIYVAGPTGRSIDVHRITSSWDETVVTWNNFGGAYAAAVEGSFTADAADWRSVDVTTLVQGWMDGSFDNYGLLLDQVDITYPRTFYYSREFEDNIPYLQVCYTSPAGSGCENVYPTGDTYITEYRPDENTGLLEVLFTGWAADNNLEKQTLVEFDLPVIEQPASIGDFVWNDADRDGVQDAGEEGMGGATVYLFDCAGTLLASTTTDANGFYQFLGLATGDYYVQFVAPPGAMSSPQDQGVDGMIDSDADPLTGMTSCTHLDPGENDMSWDAGFYFETVDCGVCDGKVTQLTLSYDGNIVDAHIVVMAKKNVTIFDGIVQPGEQFTIVGHDKNGTLGTETYYYVNGDYNSKIHTSCSRPIGPGLKSGDFTVIEGYSRFGGLICPPDSTPPSEGGECKGKVTQLTLRYDGIVVDAHIVVKGKKNVIVFDGIVQPGEQFTFIGYDKNGTLGTETYYYVNGEQNTKIHTSCSQPIGPGLVSGDFTVIEGYSRDGGLLPPL